VFSYFGDNYSWNLGLLMALQLGGELSEVDRALRHLREPGAGAGARDDPAMRSAWIAAWRGLGERLAWQAEDEAARGMRTGAARRHLRAAAYLFTAERMAPHAGPDKLPIYHAMLQSFRRGVTLRDEPVEFVEVPFGPHRLPALFYRAPGDGPRPAMIHFDGFDVTKEWIHLVRLPQELARHGVSSLVLDHPGVGGALRLLGLPTSARSEEWAAASLDHLATRGDVAIDRVGVAAMSLGGYYAPRAAAFEPRLACCVAWGARWDNALSHGRMLEDPGAARSVSGWVEHAMWVYGTSTVEETRARIAEMTLDGIAGRIRCPLLVLHGANDRQVPPDQAERTIAEALNSPRRDLRVFTEEEGGAEHVQGDLFSAAVDHMADWVGEVLGPPGHNRTQFGVDNAPTGDR
jgi:dienelactone hydrolase